MSAPQEVRSRHDKIPLPSFLPEVLRATVVVTCTGCNFSQDHVVESLKTNAPNYVAFDIEDFRGRIDTVVWSDGKKHEFQHPACTGKIQSSVNANIPLK